MKSYKFHWWSSLTSRYSLIMWVYLTLQLWRASLSVVGVGAFFFILEEPQMFAVHYAMQLPRSLLLVFSLLFPFSLQIWSIYLLNTFQAFLLTVHLEAWLKDSFLVESNMWSLYVQSSYDLEWEKSVCLSKPNVALLQLGLLWE